LLDDDLRRALSSGFGILVGAATPIVGGDECLLWHVTAPRPLVVRAAPSWRSDAEPRWAYGVAAALRAYVPEVVTPESAGIVRWRGRAVTIWPTFRVDISIVTGRMIAPPPHVCWLACIGRRCWSPIRGTDRRPIRVARRDGHGHDRRRHGGSRVGRHAGVVARRRRCLGGRAAGFLDEYRRAGGPPYDVGMIVPFIRERLRWEVARSRAAAAAGEYHDLDYEAGEVCAFAWLRDVALAEPAP
jgi:hypothetical protein